MLILDASGNVYGTTYGGGQKGGGTIYELSPTAFAGPATYIRLDADGQHVDIWNINHRNWPDLEIATAQSNLCMTFTGRSERLGIDFSNGDPLPLGIRPHLAIVVRGKTPYKLFGSSGNDSITANSSLVNFDGYPISFNEADHDLSLFRAVVPIALQSILAGLC